ncbi:hypothetical protein KIPB_005342 [Kipferlia bialata]|uniref:Uncharacterized protein n=1 Tax=Kipferlia bialata TaxID=797122 RepID=A0A9K3CXC0_9EUKA|nr:hypothetical protein KIPB_005342 [Kipferlia bialata]|eukprot:g5342.t1
MPPAMFPELGLFSIDVSLRPKKKEQPRPPVKWQSPQPIASEEEADRQQAAGRCGLISVAKAQTGTESKGEGDSGEICECRLLSVERPEFCHDCIKTGPNSAMLLGWNEEYPTKGTPNTVYTATLTEDRELETKAISAPFSGVASGVCLGDKVYVFDGGRVIKTQDDELSTAEDTEPEEDGEGEGEGGISAPSVYVYSLETEEWVEAIPCGSEGPTVRYPRGAVAISDTEFLVILGKYNLTQDKCLQAWICNTRDMSWKRCANPPPLSEDDEPVTDGQFKRTMFGIGYSNSRVHLVGHAYDAFGDYHAEYALPTADAPAGGPNGFQALPGNLALGFTEEAVYGYDTARHMWGKQLAAIPYEGEEYLYHYTSCTLGEDTVLVLGSLHPDFPETPLTMLLTVSVEDVRQSISD